MRVSGIPKMSRAQTGRHIHGPVPGALPTAERCWQTDGTWTTPELKGD